MPAAGSNPPSSSQERDRKGDFAALFANLTGHRPMPWQRRLYADWFAEGRIPDALDLPTGLGKTSVMAIWYLALRAGAALPRRLVYVVDRRAVVDQASAEAERIREHARKHFGDDSLKISTLRGRHLDNREWLADPAAPAIIVGTVDMIGSRLLFAGYGMRPRMRPYAAGLLGVDTLVVLDESHLVPPFERLIEQIAHDRDGHGRDRAFGPADEEFRRLLPGLHLLPLSATGRARDGAVFRLDEEDHAHGTVRQRLDAAKRLRFVSFRDEKALPERLAEEAWRLADEGAANARILVYCHSRQVAQKVKETLEKKSRSAKVRIAAELLTGARRIREREKARGELERLGFFSGGRPPERPAFVIATAAGEVGVDLDADHMVMDLVPFERMVQRLGRVNRLGGKTSEIVVVEPAERPQPKKKETPSATEARALIAWKAGRLLARLPEVEDGVHDASPGALVALKDAWPQEAAQASTPEPLYPPLTRPLVDAWAMTSLKEHTGRPEVQPWLRGWVEEAPQATVIWRHFLPVRLPEKGGPAGKREVAAFFAAAPPHLAEMLETEAAFIADVVTKRAGKLLKKSSRDGAERSDRDPRTPLAAETPVAFLLDRAGRYQSDFWTLEQLAQASKGRDRKAFEAAIAGRILVLDARLGGLSADGLLNSNEKDPAEAADGSDGWPEGDGESSRPLVPLRLRVESAGEDGGPDRLAGSGQWLPAATFDLARTPEGEPLTRLVIEKWADEANDEDQRSILRAEQLLDEHLVWVREEAEKLVARLGLAQAAPELAEAVVRAAALHDLGKKAPRWQQAFRAPAGGIYAKTKGPLQWSILGGYRHELGSLLYLAREGEKALAGLKPEMRELARHLIVAHHGNGRPLISTQGCDLAPPSSLEREACEIALRFARLNRRYGPWGLAWLEALVRAADQRASRRLEEEAGQGDAAGAGEKTQATLNTVASAGIVEAATIEMRGQETGGHGHG